MKTKHIALAAACLALSGCTTMKSVQMSATPRSVTYDNVYPETIEEATLKAQVHCSQFDRDAELVPDALPDGRATFRCAD